MELLPRFAQFPNVEIRIALFSDNPGFVKYIIDKYSDVIFVIKCIVPKYPWVFKALGMSSYAIDRLCGANVRPGHWYDGFLEAAGDNLFKAYIEVTKDTDVMNNYAEYCIARDLADPSRLTFSNIIKYCEYDTINKYTSKLDTSKVLSPGKNIDGLKWFLNHYSDNPEYIFEYVNDPSNEYLKYLIDNCGLVSEQDKAEILVSMVNQGFYDDAEEFKRRYNIDLDEIVYDSEVWTDVSASENVRRIADIIGPRCTMHLYGPKATELLDNAKSIGIETNSIFDSSPCVKEINKIEFRKYVDSLLNDGTIGVENPFDERSIVFTCNNANIEVNSCDYTTLCLDSRDIDTIITWHGSGELYSISSSKAKYEFNE